MSLSVASKLRMFAMPTLLLLALLQGSARADQVDRLVEQLTTSKDYKVRLSAALSLGKLDDKRAIPAFVRALRDSNKNVRGVAATTLPTLMDKDTDASVRKRVLDALQSMARRERDGFVKEQAEESIAAIKKLESAGSGGGIYVNIGNMSAKPEGAAKMRDLMRKTAEQTFSKRANSMMTSWPSGSTPSAKQLRDKKTSGYHVDGTLVALETESKGTTTLVSCKISMLIATYPEKSMFGFLDGGARVQTGSSSQDIAYAQEDCVVAVVEDLVAKKIIPVIQQRH